jgi:hypothetical protein
MRKPKPNKKKRCDTLHCRRKAVSGRKKCSTCRSRAWRKKNPERYAYNTLKGHAKADNVYFGLTFEEFCEFAHKHNYIKGRGITAEGLHVDRKIVGKYPGYVKDNIQPLKNVDNVHKRWYIDYNWQTKEAKVMKQQQSEIIDEDLPF